MRFFASLMFLALFLALTAFACDKKKVKKPGKPPMFPPDGNNKLWTGCGDGFSVELAKESYKEAFEFTEFVKDEETGSFNGEMKVKLSGLTNANGFVSNHVWIHPDKNKFAMPFKEVGKYIPPSANKKKATWQDGAVAGQALDFDRIFCGFGKLGANPASYKPAIADPEDVASTIIKGDVFEDYNPANLDGTKAFLSTIPVGDNLKTSDPAICKDRILLGDIIQFVGVGTPFKKGKLKVGYKQGTDFTTQNSQHWDEEYEPNMDKTGAYYVRDSAAYKYKDAVNGVHLPETFENHVHANDTDLLYDEVLAFIENSRGGDEMVTVGMVFNNRKNESINHNYEGQPVSGDGNYLSGGRFSFGFTTTGRSLGSNLGGGWQKLFTTTPCDTMKNGIAVAYGHVDEEEAENWKKEPTFTFDSSTGIGSRELTIVKGEADATDTKLTNKNALLFESMVSPPYEYTVNGPFDVGFFAIQHYEKANLVSISQGGFPAAETNVFTTRGVIHCRSALVLEDDDSAEGGIAVVESLFADENAPQDEPQRKNKEELAKFANKLVGYKDGGIEEGNKGPGLTCYLGLSALWPEAIDGAPKAVATHTHQLSGDKKEEGKYDVSDKHLGILMINMPEDVTVDNATLAPIFNQFTSDGVDAVDTGAAKTIDATKDKAKSILKDIKADSKFGYLHGNVKVTFSKE